MADIIFYVFLTGLVVLSILHKKRIENFLLDLLGGEKYAAQKKAHPPVDMKPGAWQDRDKGIEYTYARGKFRGNFLKISVKCDACGDFLITKENVLDRFFIKWGICTKIKTGDGLFDDKFFITTNTAAFTKAYFAKLQHRSLVGKIFDKGFIAKIKCDGKKITASSLPFIIPDERSQGMIKEIAALLLEMAGDIPAAHAPDEAKKRSWKRKRAAAFSFTAALRRALFPAARGPELSCFRWCKNFPFCRIIYYLHMVYLPFGSGKTA